jgi:hypothetical protein
MLFPADKTSRRQNMVRIFESGNEQKAAKATSSGLRTDRLKTVISQHKVTHKQDITPIKNNSACCLTVISGLIDLGTSNAAYAKRL